MSISVTTGRPNFSASFMQRKRLAIAFGMGEPEVAANLFLGVAALVMADEHHLVPAHAGQAADDGGVVAEVAVAVQFAELAADHLDVILEERPLGMPGNLHGFPGAEVVVGLAEQRGVIRAKLAKLFGIIHLLLGLQSLQLLDLLLELGERPLEIQDVPQWLAIAQAPRPRGPGERCRPNCLTLPSCVPASAIASADLSFLVSSVLSVNPHRPTKQAR